MKKRIVALLALLMVIGACSGTDATDFQTISSNLGGDPSPTTTAAGSETTTDGERDVAAYDEESGPTGVPSVNDRKVIYDGQMQLEAADTALPSIASSPWCRPREASSPPPASVRPTKRTSSRPSPSHSVCRPTT